MQGKPAVKAAAREAFCARPPSQGLLRFAKEASSWQRLRRLQLHRPLWCEFGRVRDDVFRFTALGGNVLEAVVALNWA